MKFTYQFLFLINLVFSIEQLSDLCMNEESFNIKYDFKGTELELQKQLIHDNILYEGHISRFYLMSI